jgi:hypothetical protein
MRALRRPLLATLALALLVPASAHASNGTNPTYRFHTRADGYRIVVVAHASTLFLGVVHNARARRSGAATYYIARADTRGGKVTARIGDLGSISMSFRPSGPERLDQRDCDSRLTRARPGSFVGTLRFRGEGGYVKLNAHRLQGGELRHGDACNPAGARRLEERGRFERLTASYRRGLDATYLWALAPSSGGSYYSVYTESGGIGYAVEREAFAAAPSRAFATDDSLSFADLTPPSPFSGTGSLRRAADGAPRWTGSLAVNFPGAPNFPLTGPLFKTRLTRSW